MTRKKDKVVRKWRCTKSEVDLFTKGKVYNEYADGTFQDNTRTRWSSCPHKQGNIALLADMDWITFEEVKEEIGMFDKNALVIGDVIELTGGKKFILMPQTEQFKGQYDRTDSVFVNVKEQEWQMFSEIDADEIARVYRRVCSADFPRNGEVNYGEGDIAGKYRGVIYDATKPKVKELTVEEISKLLGYEVKVVKG